MKKGPVMQSTDKVDLHIHTTASSDGQHTPEEIFEMVSGLGLKAIAFSDHNSVGSLDEGVRLSRLYAIEFIPCFELNTSFADMDLHILAYFIDYTSPSFHRWLDDIRAAKLDQADKRLNLLKSLGFNIDKRDLDRAANGMVPSGATFLTALLSHKEAPTDTRLIPYIDGERSKSPALNFYKDYFKKGKPAFIPLDVCPAELGIKKIREFGGVPVQAHPSDTGDENILKLIDLGLMGLEAYSSYHTPEECEHFRDMAKEAGILYTAGSDFHGRRIKPDVALGSVDGNSYNIVERLKDARNRI